MYSFQKAETYSAKTVIDDKFISQDGEAIQENSASIIMLKCRLVSALTLANRYGNTEIDELHGLVNLDIKYGNLTAGKLTRGNVKPLSKLNPGIWKGSIEEAGWLDINIRYCGNIDITKSQALFSTANIQNYRLVKQVLWLAKANMIISGLKKSTTLFLKMVTQKSISEY